MASGFHFFKMRKNPIAFFDSGVGLLSILAETKKLLPNENFVIFADQINNPYGEKSQLEIQKFTSQATKFLISNHHIKMMVLACNTATVLAIDHLRKKFTVPIVGVVPAVKPAFGSSKNYRVAVMSTPATAKSKYLSFLIKSYGRNVKTLKISCRGLEEAIEALDFEKQDELLNKFARDIKQFGADTVVLGCTHYPLIRDRIQKKLGKKILIIDSGKAIAARIKNILRKYNLFSHKKGKDIFYTTSNPKIFSKVASFFLNKPVTVLKAD